MVDTNKQDIRVEFIIDDSYDRTHNLFKISLNILVLKKLDARFSYILHLLPSPKINETIELT